MFPLKQKRGTDQGKKEENVAVQATGAMVTPQHSDSQCAHYASVFTQLEPKKVCARQEQAYTKENRSRSVRQLTLLRK